MLAKNTSSNITRSQNCLLLLPVLGISIFLAISCLAPNQLYAQPIDTNGYRFEMLQEPDGNQYFRKDAYWLGADGAASIDLGKGKVLWLFSDSFIGKDTGRIREQAHMIRNSIAIQQGYGLSTSSLTYYWDSTGLKPRDFFYQPGQNWYWLGHGTMVSEKLLVFLMKVRAIKTGLGFEVYGWATALVDNPLDNPHNWHIHYADGGNTYGLIAGSAAVLKDDKYLYSFGAVEPATHEVYLLRWTLERVYRNQMKEPEWLIDGQWKKRGQKLPVPDPLFIGGTEFSVHYDSLLNKYIQVQSFGFGEASIGLRIADSLTGKWSEPLMVFTPSYAGAKQPFMYAAKAHPELLGDGIAITYNINSFDFNEVVSNQSIYYPRFILLKILPKK